MNHQELFQQLLAFMQQQNQPTPTPTPPPPPPPPPTPAPAAAGGHERGLDLPTMKASRPSTVLTEDDVTELTRLRKLRIPWTQVGKELNLSTKILRRWREKEGYQDPFDTPDNDDAIDEAIDRFPPNANRGIDATRSAYTINSGLLFISKFTIRISISCRISCTDGLRSIVVKT